MSVPWSLRHPAPSSRVARNVVARDCCATVMALSRVEQTSSRAVCHRPAADTVPSVATGSLNRELCNRPRAISVCKRKVSDGAQRAAIRCELLLSGLRTGQACP